MPEIGQSGIGVRCVVLAPDGVPAALSASLERRGVVAQVVADPFRAMAAAMTAVRAGEAPVALLVVEPGRVHRSAELVRAVERFAPQVNRWRYDADGEPKLRGFVLEQAEVTGGNGVSMAPGAGARSFPHHAPPTLRLTGEMAPTGPAEELAGADEERAEEEMAGGARELLTDEELEMLLSDGPLPEDFDRGGEGGRS